MEVKSAIANAVRNRTNAPTSAVQVMQAKQTLIAEKLIDQYAILPNNSSVITRSLPQTMSLTYTFVNGTGAAINYNVMGNSTINTPDGRTYVAPTTCSDGSAGAIVNKYIAGGRTVVVTSTVYTCGTGEGLTQFAQRFGVNQGDFGNTVFFKNINVSVATSPMNYNADQLKFATQWEIDNNANLVLTVAANTSVTMSFTTQLM